MTNDNLNSDFCNLNTAKPQSDYEKPRYDKHTYRLTQSDLENIANRLGKASRSSNGYMCVCPSHDDKTPSLSISLGDDGTFLVKCFAGCEFEDILKEIKNRGLLPSHNHEYNLNSQNGNAKKINYGDRQSPQKQDVQQENSQEVSETDEPKALKLSVSTSSRSTVKKSMQERFKAILPVPDDAPVFGDSSCSGMSKKFGCNPSSLYPYHNLDGFLVGYIVRWDGVLGKDGTTKKETRPYVYAEDERGRKSWVSMGLSGAYPLYNLPEIVKRVNDPVLIVEGEKAAQKAKDLLPDYVLSTTMFGAMSPRKTDWSPLKGRDIVICPDFDDAGKKYGDAVFLLCKEVGARSIQYLPIEKMAKEWLGIFEIPNGYDIADAQEDGLSLVLKDSQTIEDLIVPYLTQFEIESQSLPKNRYRLSDRGSVEYYWEKKDKYGEVVDSGWTFLCSYLMVTHLMRDGKSDEWSRILKMHDKDGVQKEFKMPMSLLAGDGNVLKERLLSLGVMLNLGATQHLKSYISMSNPKARARAFDKTGWDDNCYILSEDKIYSRDSKDSRKKERLILNIQGHNPVFEQKGCLEEWQKTVGKYVLGNSRLQFGILAALAAPLLKLLEEDNFGVHYFGSSSIGKSITLHVANSVWGKKIHTWRTTDNAAESLARGSNDGLLILDELSQVGGDHADAMSYMLGNGQGKARANRKGEARAISEFRLIFLSSGEIGLETKLSESKNNKKLKAGQTVRFIEIPADAGKGMGVFENIHEFKEPGKFADHLKELSMKYKGTLIDAWLQTITDDRDEIVHQIQFYRKKWLKEHPLERADGQVERVRVKIALLAAVGEMAIHYGVLLWERGDASRVCVQILNSWLNQRGGVESHEMMEVVNRLLKFMEIHGSSRFEHVESRVEKELWQEVSARKNENTYDAIDRVHTLKNTVTHNRAGFKVWDSISEEGKKELIEKIENKDGMIDLNKPTLGDGIPSGVVWRHYFLQEAFETEILQGGNKKILLPALAEKGLLVTTVEKVKDGKDAIRYTHSVRLTGYQQQRLYKISHRDLEEEN